MPDHSSPLRIMVQKEVADHVRGWRLVVLLSIILLTFFGALYVSLANIRSVVHNTADPDHIFLYLKLLTITDQSLPPFHVFLSFLAPLLGIGLGFDAVNSEQNNGTLIRLMGQPVYRDNFLLSKFLSGILIVTYLFAALALLMIGAGLLMTGVPIEPEEVLRIVSFVTLTVVYIAFWLSLSILLSIKFQQPATSALAAIALWLFFTAFYQIIVSFVVKTVLPDPAVLSAAEIQRYNNLILTAIRLAPSQLYSDGTTTLLMPSVRSLGPLTMEQMAGAIPSPLPFKESLMIVWAQVTALVGATTSCFALSYYLFMRREIRT